MLASRVSCDGRDPPGSKTSILNSSYSASRLKKKAHRLYVRRFDLFIFINFKTIPIKDALSLYFDNLYVRLLFLDFFNSIQDKSQEKTVERDTLECINLQATPWYQEVTSLQSHFLAHLLASA
jgi:hypothetical protein